MVSLTFNKAFNSVLILIGLLIFIFRSLNPLLQSGFYADDMSNSLSWTNLTNGGPSRYQIILQTTPSGPVGGRYYPLSNYAYFLFDFVHGSAVAYKLIIVFTIVISLFLFALFVLEVFGRKDIAIFSILILPLFMQFRIFYDPITSFHAFMQVLFIFLMLTLIFLNRYLVKKRLIYLISSLSAFICTLLLYEISYLFIFMIVFLILRSAKNIKTKIIYISFYIIPLARVIILSLNERQKYESMPAYQINFNAMESIPALFRQMYAAFPLSYYKSNPDNMFSYDFQSMLHKVVLGDLITVLLFVGTITFVIKRTNWIKPRIRSLEVQHQTTPSEKFNKNYPISSANVKNNKLKNNKLENNALLIFGFLLLIIPNLLIALSPTYQYLIYWGVSHLPVYISYFGAYLIISVVVDSALLRLRNYWKIGVFWLLIIATSAGYLINFQNNRQVIEIQNQTYWYERNFLELMQKKSNFINQIPDNSLILFSVDDNLSLDVQPFIFSLAGREIKNVDTRRLLPWYKNIQDSNKTEKYKAENLVYWNNFGTSEKDLFIKYANVYILKYWSDSFEKGYLTLSKISNLVLDGRDNAVFVKITETNIYLLKIDPGVVDVFFKSYPCPKLLSNCPAKLIHLSLSPKEVPTIQGKYSVIRVDLQNSVLPSSDWIDFKSIQFGGMDKLIK